MAEKWLNLGLFSAMANSNLSGAMHRDNIRKDSRI